MAAPGILSSRRVLARQGALLAALVLCSGAISCNKWSVELKSKEERATEAGAAGGHAQPSAEGYEKIAEQFGRALVAGEYSAAYQLTSSRLHKRLTEKEFAQTCGDAAKQFGQAERLGPVAIELTDGLDGDQASQQYGFPAEIPDGDRLAWAHAAIALEVDGEEILRCYDCWMLLENDHGKARVGHFKFTFCGE
jgi:hypothetical protein